MTEFLAESLMEAEMAAQSFEAAAIHFQRAAQRLNEAMASVQAALVIEQAKEE